MKQLHHLFKHPCNSIWIGEQNKEIFLLWLYSEINRTRQRPCDCRHSKFTGYLKRCASAAGDIENNTIPAVLDAVYAIFVSNILREIDKLDETNDL